MRNKLFRILGFGGLAVFMGAVTIFGCALPRFANAENAVVSAESGNLSSPAAGSANASGASHEIVPRASDEVIYTTSQGLAVKKQNATLYMTINGVQYEVIGQGDGTTKVDTVAGYTDLEYLQFTGTQYLSSISLGPSFKMEYDVSLDTTTAYYNLYDNDGLGGSTARMLWIDSNGCIELNASTPRPSVEKNTRLSIIADATGSNTLVKVNGTTVITGSKPNRTDTITLFNRKGAQGFKGKIYNLKIYNNANNVLTRDYIPVRNSSGTLGFYDLVGNVFYTNSGSGSFTAGPNKIPAWSNASTHADNSPAASAILNDSNNSKRKLDGVASVGGAPVGYLVVKNSSAGTYLKVRI